jgi:hypothetical protein
MAPLVASGAVVSIVRPRRYWPGDAVVVHTADGRLLVHRLLGFYRGRNGWRCLTQGDGSPAPDGSLPSTSLVGRVEGGECHVDLGRVPVRHRLRASARFVKHALRAATRRA